MASYETEGITFVIQYNISSMIFEVPDDLESFENENKEGTSTSLEEDRMRSTDSKTHLPITSDKNNGRFSENTPRCTHQFDPMDNGGFLRESKSSQTDDDFLQPPSQADFKPSPLPDLDAHHENSQIERNSTLKSFCKDKLLWRWKIAIDGSDTEEITRLTKESIIPNKYLLNHLCYKFGYESALFYTVCDRVCNFISNCSEDVTSVVPTYKLFSPNKIIFLVYIRKKTPVFELKDFDLIFRNIDEYSNEGKEIHKKEVQGECIFTKTEFNNITSAIENNSEFLLGKHKNLQIISPSFYKSSNYGKDHETMENITCIALFVSVKGYIPIYEGELPSSIDNIPTDVREGGFEFFSSACDWHTHLKMGCEIAGSINLNGTLGPFFKEGGHKYCLTAAHVLFDHNLIPKGIDLFEWPSTKTDENQKQKVFQPNPLRNPNWKQKPFGEVYRAFYKRGNRTLPGMEIAVIEITDLERKPISGEFPDCEEPMVEDKDGEEQTHILLYETGEIAEKDLVDNNHGVEVIKFGAATEKTHGRLRFSRSSFRKKCVFSDKGDIILYNQLEVSNLEEGYLFAEHGDSGAVVLASLPDVSSDLLALGLLVGRASTGMTLMTPMYAILDELGLSQRRLMGFETVAFNQTKRNKSGLEASAILPKTFLEKLDSIDQTLSQEVAKHTHDLKLEMEDNMRVNFDNFKESYFDQEIGSVKQSVKDMNSRVEEISESFQKKIDAVDQRFSQELEKQTEHLKTGIEKKVEEKLEKIERFTQCFPEMMSMVKQILENQNKSNENSGEG